ncbi:MAG: hypothetical protein KME11_05005 [Timaviella obliquedivisa GSE-PSE-MK23-08B]|jgi:hypothetical protein|nr:hypothetical protein [Timaviella obliquedivisa GSE-PSE-MK23-08B]
MSLNTLQQRLKSTIPTPVASAGYALDRSEVKQVIYNGTTLPYFLMTQKASPKSYRAFLKQNAIGRVFTGLESGRVVTIENPSTFTRHPDY